MKIETNNQTILSQLGVRAGIFLLFFLGIFIELPSLILYLFLPLIAANIILGFINKKRSIFTNIIFLLYYPLLFIVLIEYLVTILGAIISFVHLLLFSLWYFKEKK